MRILHLRFVQTVVLGVPLVFGACSSGRSTPKNPDPVVIASRELTADQQIRHVLNRLGYGARPGDIERVRARGVDRWIADQLEPDRVPDPNVDSALEWFPSVGLNRDEVAEIAAARATLNRTLRERRRLLRSEDSVAGSRALRAVRADSAGLDSANRRVQRLFVELQEAKVARAVVSDRQLLEVMVDFWENHFSVFAGKGPVRFLLLEYDRDVIRPRALGRFRDLLRAVAKSAAMLYYLDNWQSGAEPDRPTLGGMLAQRRAARDRRRTIPPMQFGKERLGLNENYARELLELHTLGVNGGYTQQDVINVARALTGWSVKEPETVGTFVFRPEVHDAGRKRIMSLKLGEGRGIEDGEDVLDYLARHPTTARFIATKLVQRFVSDSAPPDLVTRAADAFLRTDGNIRDVLRTIVTSPEFFSRAAYRAKVKSPFELVASALRAINATVDTTHRAVGAVAQLGEPLFNHQAPDGYPDRAIAWINSGSILNRINFGLRVANPQYPGIDWAAWLAVIGADRPSRSEQVDAVLDAILGGEASVETRDILKHGVNPLGGPAPPPSGTEAPADLAGLVRMVGLALGAPEFQRR